MSPQEVKNYQGKWYLCSPSSTYPVTLGECAKHTLLNSLEFPAKASFLSTPSHHSGQPQETVFKSGNGFYPMVLETLGMDAMPAFQLLLSCFLLNTPLLLHAP